MKLIKIINLILIIVFSYSFANAKPMPPGTGNSVPSNILFLVDKSQSMHNPANGTNKKSSMRPPTDVVGKGDGRYFVSGVDESGFYYWDADTNEIVVDTNVFKGSSYRVNAGKKLNLGSPLKIEYHEGKNRLYVLGDNTDHGFGGSPTKLCQKGGYVLYMMDPSKKQSNKKGFGRDSVAFFNTNMGGAFACNNGPKDSRKPPQRGFIFLGKTAIAMHENKLWIVSSEVEGMINQSNPAGGMYVLDINASSNFGFGNGKRCQDHLPIYKYFNESIDVVTENGKLYMYSKDNTSRTGQILKQELGSDGCMIADNVSAGWNREANKDECGGGKGAASIVVKNKQIYTTSYFSHLVCKYSFSGSTINLKKKVGINDAFTENNTDNEDVYLQNPMGIKFGRGSGDQDTLFVVNYGRLEVTMLDEDDLSYKDHFGDSGVSLFQGAKEAISYVLNDSATTQQANFGIAFWNDKTGTFTGFINDENGNIDYTKSTGGGSGAKLNVGINPKGAQQILDLFERDDIHLHYSTISTGFKNIINKYFNNSNQLWNPYRSELKCQTTAIILIGDGQINDKDKVNATTKVVKALNSKKNPILFFSVGYGKEVYNSQKAKDIFKKLAVAGGTENPSKGDKGFYVAETPADLKKVTDIIVQNIISRQVVFSAPSIASEIKRSGELFQAKFQNRTNKEWYGTVLKTILKSDGDAYTQDLAWDAAVELNKKKPSSRKIWTALPGNNDINNFHVDNLNAIKNLFNKQGNVINEYHRKTQGSFSANLTRCKTNSIVKDGIVNDEDKGLINFVRGEDYFDYNSNCDLTEKRMRTNEKGVDVPHMLADIYNSTLLIVGNPKASVESSSTLTESYFRATKNYSVFKAARARTEIVYGAANNGILHAFDTETGEELWGFVPPLIIPKLPTIINGSLNSVTGGGSTPKFLLDGSPVVHDTYFEHPIHAKEDWYTLLAIPYGRAGAGFSVIDVTVPNKPLHLYSILNDPIGEKIHRIDHNGNYFDIPYKTSRLNEKDFDEVQKVISNNSTVKTCTDMGNTSCYEGNTLTVSGRLLDKSNTRVIVNGKDVTNNTTFTESNGGTVLTLTKKVSYSTQQDGTQDRIRVLEIEELSGADVDYDYRRLGETWSSPRIFRMPNNGKGDNDIIDDEYVAVMTGGFGNFFPSIGSNLYVIDWTNGKVKKIINITDKQYDSSTKNDIVNSIPATPVVITAEAAQGAFSGAIVYVNDLEGKITKINLTNMSGSYEIDAVTGRPQPTTSKNNAKTNNTISNTPSVVNKKIELYDNYTFFDLDVSTETNNRYMYHSLDAGIGIKSKKLWLFGGTGDYQNLNDMMVDDSKVNNVMFGIKDKYFPYFGNESGNNMDNLSKCKNMTDDDGGGCPDSSDRGWYIELDNQKKVSAEPTLTRNVVYFPVYKPIRNDPTKCGSGDAYICSYDADCGRNLSSDLADANGGKTVSNINPSQTTSGKEVKCYYVGTGVLSKIISFGAKLYANISGTSINANKEDIVVINSIDTGLVDYRSSWRESF